MHRAHLSVVGSISSESFPIEEDDGKSLDLEFVNFVGTTLGVLAHEVAVLLHNSLGSTSIVSGTSSSDAFPQKVDSLQGHRVADGSKRAVDVTILLVTRVTLAQCICPVFQERSRCYR
jgi:hypothetical protein